MVSTSDVTSTERDLGSFFALPENKKSDQLWVKYYGLEDWKTQIKTGHPGAMFNEPKGFKREIAFWAELELITSYGKCVMLS